MTARFIAHSTHANVHVLHKRTKTTQSVQNTRCHDYYSVYEEASSVMLPEQGSTAILGGPSNNQFLLPVHVLPGQTMAASTQSPCHIEWLEQ